MPQLTFCQKCNFPIAGGRCMCGIKRTPDIPWPPPPPPKAKDPAAALAARISTEPEWQPSTAALRDAILRRFTERLDAVCATAPDRLNTALAVIVQAGPGRTVLVISDPAAADFVAELRRHVEAGEPSPLTALLNSRLPI